MCASRYEQLKCEGCGKTLGYAYISATTSFLRMMATRQWPTQGPQTPEIETLSVSAFCESCFEGKGKLETKGEKRRNAETQTKSKNRSLIR